MATITSLGFNLWTRFHDKGIKEAERGLAKLDGHISTANQSFRAASGQASALSVAMLATAPSAAVMGAAVVAAGSAIGVQFALAGAAMGAYGGVLSATIKRTVALRDEGSALNGAQQKYIDSVTKMTEKWNGFLDANAGNTLSVARDGVAGLTAGISRLQPILDATHPVIKKTSEAWRAWMEGDSSARFVDSVVRYGVPALDSFMMAGRNMLAVLGQGFRDFTPLGVGFAETLLRASQAARDWAVNGGFQQFIAYVRANIPALREFFTALVAALRNVAMALAETGPSLLKMMTSLLNFIAVIPTDVIVSFFQSLLALKVIVVVSGWVGQLVTTLRILAFAFGVGLGPIGLIAAAVAGLVVGFIFLWNRFEGFRNFWIGAWEVIQKVSVWAWENVLKPTFKAIGDAFMWVWEHIIRPVVNWIRDHWGVISETTRRMGEIFMGVMRAIGTVVSWLWENVCKPVFEQIGDTWEIMCRAVSIVWENVYKPVLSAAGEAILALGEKVPTFSEISEAWRQTGIQMEAAWDLTISPVLTNAGIAFDTLWTQFAEPRFSNIEEGWSGLATHINLVWDTDFAPTLDDAGVAFNILWESRAKTSFERIGSDWDTLASGFETAWYAKFKPTLDEAGNNFTFFQSMQAGPALDEVSVDWNKLADSISIGWDLKMKPVFDDLGSAVDKLSSDQTKSHFKTFGDQWIDMGSRLQIAWNTTIGPTFSNSSTGAEEVSTRTGLAFVDVGTGWSNMGMRMRIAYDTVLKPVLDNAGTAFTWLSDNVAKPAFDTLDMSWAEMAISLHMAWKLTIGPTFDNFGSKVSVMWNVITQPIFTSIGDKWDTLAMQIRMAWDMTIGPTFDNFGSKVSVMWTVITQPIFTSIGTKWESLGTQMGMVWNLSMGPVFDKFGTGVEWLRDRGAAALDQLGRAWGELAGKIHEPVKWIINTVWNDGLRKAWNWINDLWGGGDIEPFSFATGGGVAGGGRPMKAFREGGPVHGPGTTTSDSIVARLSHNEHVWTAREVSAAGGHGAVAALRSAVLGGQRVREMGATGFAAGGGLDLVNPGPLFGPAMSVAKNLTGFTQLMNGLRGTINGGSGKFAGMVANMAKSVPSKALDAVVEWVTKKLTPVSGPSMSWQEMWSIIKGAFPDASKTSDHRPGDPGYHGSGNALDVAWPMTQHGKSRMLELNKWIAGRYPGSTELIHTPGINLKNGKPYTYNAATQAGHFNHVHWAMAGGPGGGGDTGAGGWRSLIVQELGHFGQVASDEMVNIVARRLNQESGGNARAINNWDINAKNGTPSKGLMQVIDPTFHANKNTSLHPDDIWDPGANMHAAFRYAIGRYGSLPAAFNRPGGYKLGTRGANSGWRWAGEDGPELIKFRGGEKVWNSHDTSELFRGGDSDRPLIDTRGAPLIDARGSTKEAAEKLDKDVLPKLIRVLEQGAGKKYGG